MLPFILAVNRDILSDHGLEIPQNWEELKAMGPLLKKHGIDAFTMPGGVNLDTAYRFLPLLFRAGGRVFNADWSAAAFNGPAGVAALSMLVDMKSQGFMPAAQVQPTALTRMRPIGLRVKRLSQLRGPGGRIPWLEITTLI